jgi:hypothetical protein
MRRKIVGGQFGGRGRGIALPPTRTTPAQRKPKRWRGAGMRQCDEKKSVRNFGDLGNERKAKSPNFTEGVNVGRASPSGDGRGFVPHPLPSPYGEALP